MLDNDVKALKTLSAEYNNTVYEMQDKIKNTLKKKADLKIPLINLKQTEKVLENCQLMKKQNFLFSKSKLVKRNLPTKKKQVLNFSKPAIKLNMPIHL